MATSARHGPGIEKKKGSKEITYSVPQDGRRPGSAAAAAGSATEGSCNYFQRERERERERERGERGREREEEGRGGEREKGEREKRGREIEGALNFFPHLPCAVSSSFRRLLHPGDSQESLFLIASPFSFLPSPFSSHSPNVPLPPAGRNIKHHGDNPVFIRAPFSPVSGNGRPRDGRRPELECAK